MVHVVLQRARESGSKAEKLEAEKKKLVAALEGSSRELKAAEEKINSQEVEMGFALQELCNVKAETHELRGMAAVKEKKILALKAELAKLDAELKMAHKEKTKLQASFDAEIEKYYQDGVDVTSKEYEAQVQNICSELFELGYRAALKKAGIPDDHPVYQDLPKFTRPGTQQNPAPTTDVAVEVVPPEDAPQVTRTEPFDVNVEATES